MSMNSTVQLKSLSPARRQLVHWFQELNFARIVNLAITNGEPVLTPRPLAVREVKFCSENGPRAESSLGDFALKAQVLELFKEFDALRDGVIESLVIKHGLPFSMNVRAAA